MGGSPGRALAPAFALVVAAAGCAPQTSAEPSGLQAVAADAASVEEPPAAPLRLAGIERPAPSTVVTAVSRPSAGTTVDASDPKARRPSLVARAIVSEISVFVRPGGQPLTSFRIPGPFGEPRVFLVREVRERWLRVMLPMRPNGADGWISSQDVRISRHRFAVQVDLSERRLILSRGIDIILRRRVAVGSPESPTPTGLFFTTILARATDPSGPYGPFAYGLSGYSEVYSEFGGGDGQIAIHGTDAPHLIGQAVSAGCVRMRNDDLVRLGQDLPLGTPVRIVR